MDQEIASAEGLVSAENVSDIAFRKFHMIEIPIIFCADMVSASDPLLLERYLMERKRYYLGGTLLVHYYLGYFVHLYDHLA